MCKPSPATTPTAAMGANAAPPNSAPDHGLRVEAGMTAVSAPMSQMSEEMCAAAHTAGSLGDGLDHGDEGDEDDDDGSEAHGGLES